MTFDYTGLAAAVAAIRAQLDAIDAARPAHAKYDAYRFAVEKLRDQVKSLEDLYLRGAQPTL
jgi:hypothetical protein